MFELHVDGLSRWMPLDLEADAEEYTQRLQSGFADTPGIELVAPGVAGLAGNLRRGALQTEEDGVVLLAAWLFFVSDERLEPLATATLRAVPLEPGATVDSFAAELLGDHEVYGTPESDNVATFSGTARRVRFRPVLRVDGEREVHEQTCVFWLRPDQQFAALLSAYCTDLLTCHELPEALTQLAEGVRGL